MGSKHDVELAVHRGEEQCDERIIQYYNAYIHYRHCEVVQLESQRILCKDREG